jgi:hypothetical protein
MLHQDPLTCDKELSSISSKLHLKLTYVFESPLAQESSVQCTGTSEPLAALESTMAQESTVH